MAWNTLFPEFDKEYQAECTERALAWGVKHLDHVAKLRLSEIEYTYPPSGSDCGKPELWKGGSWNWFYKVHCGEKTKA